MSLIQVHQRAYRPHQAFGGGPVGDDITDQHRVEQLG
jgi:hypothetical protein